ncbi:MAG TPA: hypothetical protein VEL76_13055 [Gemmataceae bacterium]|nr:hypothetical protein [Gemmataceae bacterium]
MVRLRDLIEAHVKTLSQTADSRHTRLLVTALEECLRRAVERDRIAADLAERDAEVQRLREQVKRLQERVEKLAALAATPPDEAEGEAPAGWRLVYRREFRSATLAARWHPPARGAAPPHHHRRRAQCDHPAPAPPGHRTAAPGAASTVQAVCHRSYREPESGCPTPE